MPTSVFSLFKKCNLKHDIIKKKKFCEVCDSELHEFKCQNVSCYEFDKKILNFNEFCYVSIANQLKTLILERQNDLAKTDTSFIDLKHGEHYLKKGL